MSTKKIITLTEIQQNLPAIEHRIYTLFTLRSIRNYSTSEIKFHNSLYLAKTDGLTLALVAEKERSTLDISAEKSPKITYDFEIVLLFFFSFSKDKLNVSSGSENVRCLSKCLLTAVPSTRDTEDQLVVLLARLEKIALFLSSPNLSVSGFFTLY